MKIFKSCNNLDLLFLEYLCRLYHYTIYNPQFQKSKFLIFVYEKDAQAVLLFKIYKKNHGSPQTNTSDYLKLSLFSDKCQYLWCYLI